MPCTSSEALLRHRRALALTLLAYTAACTFTAPPSRPRPPLSADELGLPVVTVPRPQLTALHEDAPGRWSGTLTGDGEQVAFQLRGDAGRSGAPVVLLVPILAGGADLMESVARRVQARGFDVAFCARADGALKQGQRGRQLDELFRRTVLHQRLLLRWLRERAPTPVPLFALGMSLGGMVATVLAAEEPDLAGTAVCLSGGDIKTLIAASSESRVQRWRRWRLDEDGIGDDSLRDELAQCLDHEPLRYAPAVPTDRVLLVSAEFDTVIPQRHQDLLWEAFGRPARFTVPFGHYTAALAIDTILAKVTSHFSHTRN